MDSLPSALSVICLAMLYCFLVGKLTDKGFPECLTYFLWRHSEHQKESLLKNGRTKYYRTVNTQNYNALELHQLEWKSNGWFISMNFKSWFLIKRGWQQLFYTTNSIAFSVCIWATMRILYFPPNLWHPSPKIKPFCIPGVEIPGFRTFSAKTRAIADKLELFMPAGIRCYSA